MDLTEFLLARIAEDEAVARAATPGPWTAQAGTQVMPPPPWADFARWEKNAVANTQPGNRTDNHHIARHDPPRALAECEAKRRIAELALHADRTERDSAEAAGWDSAKFDTAGAEILRSLASVYADHPAYQQEWASWQPA